MLLWEELKLSVNQKRAFRKLLNEPEWVTAEWLNERKQTLNSLVRVGLAKRNGETYKIKYRVIGQ